MYIVLSYNQDCTGGLTSELLNSYFADEQPFLAAGGATGVISIWNLEKRKLQAVIEDAHISAVNSLHFLASEPVLLSSGSDNSLKVGVSLFFIGSWAIAFWPFVLTKFIAGYNQKWTYECGMVI